MWCVPPASSKVRVRPECLVLIKALHQFWYQKVKNIALIIFYFFPSLAVASPHSSSTSVGRLGSSQRKSANVRGGRMLGRDVGFDVLVSVCVVLQPVVKTCLFA